MIQNLRHGHRETIDRYIVVEWLENIARDQRMVNAGILVPVKTLQVLLAYVDHLGKASRSTLSILLGCSHKHQQCPTPVLWM